LIVDKKRETKNQKRRGRAGAGKMKEAREGSAETLAPRSSSQWGRHLP
jgi:hypothetical protein